MSARGGLNETPNGVVPGLVQLQPLGANRWQSTMAE
jgi:hypothetical protein